MKPILSEWRSAWDAVWEAPAKRRFCEILALAVVCTWAFFTNLSFSLLEGSEGLYAGIAGEMGRRNEFFDLTYQGEPYFNKPPFFFWLLHVSTSIWGDNEIALRVPGSLAAVGTVMLTYVLATGLMSSTAGFWAALAVATSHVFLWYGRRVLFDSTLALLITLALFSWAQVQLRGRSSRWYLLGFLSMALGAMLKEMHGFFLPLLVMALYAAIQRDGRMFKDRWFWGGLVGAVAMMTGYAQMLGPGYQHHFHLGAALKVIWNPASSGPPPDAHPFYWYLGMIWADFFPWSLLLPPAVLLLWSRRPFPDRSVELLSLIWVFGLLIAFSLASMKREPYLVPMVPGFGLMIGYYYRHMLSPSEQNTPMPPLLRPLLGLLAVLFAVGIVIGPLLLKKRWLVPPDFVSPLFTLVIVAAAGVLLYAVIRSRLHLALYMVGGLAIGFMATVVNVVFPAIDQAFSPRKITEEIKAMAVETRPTLYQYIPGWPKNEDAVYYLKRDQVVPDLPSQEAIVDAARRNGTIRVITEEKHAALLEGRPDLMTERIREFRQPSRKHLLLLSVRGRS